MMVIQGKLTVPKSFKAVPNAFYGNTMTGKLISFINGEHHRLSLAFIARNLEDEQRFSAIGPERVSARPEPPSRSPVQRSACAPTANKRSISAPPRADPKSGSISARIAAATLWESDRSPA